MHQNAAPSFRQPETKPQPAPTLSQLDARFAPKLIDALREGYSLGSLRTDALAGLTVAIVALPLAMGIAIASGVAPSVGLMTAILTGFVISALGGSRVQIGGPTAAFAVVVFGIVAEHGLNGLALATLMAGALLIACGMLRAGNWLRFVPQSVVTGFTAGIALTIASTQLGALLGLSVPDPSGEVLPRLLEYMAHWRTADFVNAGLGLGSILVILLLRRFRPGWPGFLIACVGLSTVAALLRLPADTVGSVFGNSQNPFHVRLIDGVDLRSMGELLPAAFTIAFLAGIESLLSATVADGMTGRRHRPNTELVAQGIANIASGLVGGLPATGAIARTATNIRAGARTPVAGILHAVLLAILALLASPLLGHVPLAVLAGVLMVVAWTMAEPPHVARMLARAPSGDRLVTLVTLCLTVAADLTVAVQVGVLLAAVLFMHQMSTSFAIRSSAEENAELRARLPAGTEVFEIDGPIFYAVVARLQRTLEHGATPASALILRLERATLMDATGAGAISELARSLSTRGGTLLLASPLPEVIQVLKRLGVLAAANVKVCEDFETAIDLASAEQTTS